MLDELHRLNDEVEAERDLREDLEPTDEAAAEITGGDTTPVISTVLRTHSDTLKSVAANLRG